ncbi:phosphoadenosine phosphosulfate reductase family protein [Zhouia sp. PK063]|uniref:phosphoadenosine phosphosulfate reductase family protein n=1 Tax=Zhouia sp. PK063 TaxID=3373602 RepID=UPI003789BA1A
MKPVQDLQQQNAILREKTPAEIIAWALEIAKNPIITTNFGPYSASLLHACSMQKKDMVVIWCDTGFNTSQTYAHATEVTKKLQLNLKVYKPVLETSFIKFFYGVPQPGEAKHVLFTEMVKLEPFRRAIQEHQPDVWFTNIRKGQTAYRDTLDILSVTQSGVLKVSPFYHYTTKEVYQYLQEHHLPNEFEYFDPTKVVDNRECGIQLT